MSFESARAVRAISKVVALANTDAAFKSRLISDPNAVLSSYGYSFPAGVNVHFVEAGAPVPAATPSDVYFQLGPLDRIGDVELNEEALTKAGGGSCHGSSSTMASAVACISSFSTASTKCP